MLGLDGLGLQSKGVRGFLEISGCCLTKAQDADQRSQVET